MTKQALLAALALTVLLAGTSLQADEVDIDIQAEDGNWQVLVAIDGDVSSGLAEFAFDVVGTGDVLVLSSINQSHAGFPLPADAGFVVDRTDGVLGLAIAASQPVMYAGTDPDNAMDALVVQGVGQSGWVVLASGTYSGTQGTLEVKPTVGGKWRLLENAYGAYGLQSWRGPGHTFDVPVNYDSVAIPEPASLSLLALGGIALIRRRRR